MAPTAHINRIAVGVPPHDVHQAFLHFTETLFRQDSGTLSVFRRMAERSGIEHRYSCLPLMPDWKTGPTLDAESLYTRGQFANTAARMRVFEARAPDRTDTKSGLLLSPKIFPVMRPTWASALSTWARRSFGYCWSCA